MGSVWARFDDFTSPGGSFELREVGEIFLAHEPARVRTVIRMAEQAARRGCWVAGFVSYEAASGLDEGLAVQQWPAGHPMAALPLVWFGVFRRKVSVDPLSASSLGAQDPGWRLDRDQYWHRRGVGVVRDDIAAGRYYQMNLTARLTGRVDAMEDLYARTAASQRSAYCGLLSTGEFTIASTSPELFFTRTGTRVLTRPMKGTTKRGRWPKEDMERAAALRASAKERAENVMIVDLVRNDLARIARTGTVAMSSLFDVERYPTLWQLTSSIQADARPNVGLVELFEALFPSGSVTGAPKRAAMESIARLEGSPRGVYCGAIGYLTPDPSMPPARFSVAIRTAVRAEASGVVEYGTGGGITWASQPDAEWAELLSKTAVLQSHRRPERLLETLRYEPGAGLRHLEGHLGRLESSAAYFGIPFPASAAEQVRAAVEQRHDCARVRIVLDHTGQLAVSVTDLEPAPSQVVLGIAARPVYSTHVGLFHKHGDRQSYDAERAAHPTCDDVVLWNERGEITETTTANLAVRLTGRWYTPSLECGLLPGVERGRLLRAGILAERVITASELTTADGVAVFSSLRGWRPARLTPEAVASALRIG